MNRKLKNEELDRPTVATFQKMRKTPVIVVLDNIRSLHNVGSVFRTADAFDIEAIYLCGITATPPHREIIKTALVSTESMVWKYFGDTLEAIAELRGNFYTILAFEQAEKSTSLADYEPTKNKHEKLALIFGHEVKGVQQAVIDATDVVIEIPQKGTKHSLNVSVSVGISLWEVTNKLGNH
jgi:tRNA G18 (ribose-2'-O)-methylase SpoU